MATADPANDLPIEQTPPAPATDHAAHGGRRIAMFCIPAHGHTNPMLPVAAELVRRGDSVRFYSFREFGEKIARTGAEFVPCDEFLGTLTAEQEAALKRVSITEMTVEDIGITVRMDGFLEREFATFRPDVVYTDSVCFWGKLSAWKHGVPMVVSTSTFAFNQMSSQYMKHSGAEMCDIIFGLPRIGRAMKRLKPLGYDVKNPMRLIQNDNSTDSVVYTSRRFQPFAASFSGHYLFAGPSVFSDRLPEKSKDRPLVYISLGTVINDRPDFYRKCVDALKGLAVEVVISCGNAMAPTKLGTLPANVKVFPRVDQLDVLARASVFLTHCGMNSVSESLYMAAPMVLYPQTGEQVAVARRVIDMGAGLRLKDDSVEGIRVAVQAILANDSYREGAEACSRDFRACPGPSGAADYIETAPHNPAGPDPMKIINRASIRFMMVYWTVVIAVMILLKELAGVPHTWLIGLAAGIASGPLGKLVQRRACAALEAKQNQ